MFILSEAKNPTTFLSSNFSKYVIVGFSNRKKLKHLESDSILNWIEYISGKTERQISDFYMEDVSNAVTLK